MLQAITNASVKLVNRYLPSPFVFSVILTVLAFIIGIIVTQQGAFAMARHWGEGLWSLHAFAMQMALILVLGYGLANAPIVQRFLDNLASRIHSPKFAIVVVTLVALVSCWLNWGFGLIVSAIFAKSVAKKVQGVDYPLLVASAYSGFVIWHGGISGSIPLTLASGGEDLTKLSGKTLTEAVPIATTIFSTYNLAIIIILLIGLPLLNMLMLPKQPLEIDKNLIKDEPIVLPTHNTPAEKLDDNRLMMVVVLALGMMYLFSYFSEKGFNLGLNIVIGLFLFLGILAHGTLERYYRAIENSIKGIAGIVLLFPFYGGIMGLITGKNADGVSIGTQVTDLFVSFSSPETFPLFTFISAGLVNIFVPSGGGQFAVQGPIMMPAGMTLGVEPHVTAMAIAWGDAWTNMIQPFWALPLLGIAGLDARAIMGYCLMVLLFSGVVIMGAFYFLT